MTKPAPWTLSPQLTEAPDLWDDCIFVYPFWELVGPPKQILLLDQDTNALAWGLSEHGAQIEMGGASNGMGLIQKPPNSIIGQSPHKFTLVWFGYFFDQNNDDEGIFFSYIDSDFSRGFWLTAKHWTGGNLLFEWKQDWGGGSFGLGTHGNADAVHIFRFDTSGEHGNTAEVWIGGNRVHSTTSTKDESLQTNEARMGIRLKGEGAQNCRFFGLWQDWQSDEFIQRMTADPYAMIRPRSL